MNFEEIKPLYDEITYLYEELQDTDHDTAFYLMKYSSSTTANLETLIADMMKELAIQERYAKSVQAKISCEHSKKVTEGDRFALQNDEVMAEWARVADIQKSIRYLEASNKFLQRVYFDSKLVYESCQRQLRQPVGNEKLVGRY